MAVCPACRASIPDQSKFCSACGTPVVGGTLTSPETVDAPSSSRPPSSGSHHGRFDPGHRIGERYRIVGLLGEGGMGEVYRADDLELGQSVALKFLPDRLVADPAELERFRREVRIARGIAHPNVCRTYDIATLEGHVFLVMEYVDGEDLASVLRRMGRPSPDKAMEIARQLCLGLGAAHEAGVLHRDLKPANIMIDGRGKVRITDFGLAGLAEELAEESAVAGTPAYMAPEQLRDGKVSVQSDIFSLGLILHEIFTGKRVFDTHNIAELKKLHSESSLSSPSSLVQDLDPAAERLLLRCLETDPSRRPSSAYAVLAGLPGGDPLAAALAAGETPSPELVANARERGVISPRVGIPVLLAVLAVFLGLGVLRAEALRPLTESPAVLAVQAGQVYDSLVGGEPLPYRTGGLIRSVPDSLEARPPFDTGFLYWRVWSPRAMESPEFHTEGIYPNRLQELAHGDVGIVLDMEGNLLGFRRAIPDSLSWAGVADVAPLFAAMGLDSTDYARSALPDTVAPGSVAWERVSGEGPERIEAVYHAGILAAMDTEAPLLRTDRLFRNRPGQPAPVPFVLFGMLPILAATLFAVRNLRLGRGDRRGATLFALVVFVAYMVESLLMLSLGRMDLGHLLTRLSMGIPFGHALYHAAFVWVGYMALEPYLRKTRPTMLVSWARLVGRRWRDPILGRDVLAGLAGAAALMVLMTGTSFLLRATNGLDQFHGARESELFAVSRFPDTLAQIAYSVAFAPPLVMLVLVFYLGLLVVLRRERLALGALLALPVVLGGLNPGDLPAWYFGLGGLFIGAVTLIVIFRFGVFAGAVLFFVMNLQSSVPWALAPGTWYGATAALGPVLVCILAVWAMFTAMGGQLSLGGVLGDEDARDRPV